MRETRTLMGMPITVEIADPRADAEAIDHVFRYFQSVDERFSTYKEHSEISRINRGELKPAEYSPDMREVFRLCDETAQLTGGYFDIRNRDGILDPSGLVKGWSIQKAAELLDAEGWKHFYIDAGGDIQPRGRNAEGKPWRVGIRHPFLLESIVKTIYPGNHGVATSGTYLRGQHIYNPKDRTQEIHDIVSLTVIGPNVYEADRFATAAFAMGAEGIHSIERLHGYEGYQIDANGQATMTTGFAFYTKEPALA